MNHPRQRIRAAVAARLAGLPSAGSRVFDSRIYPVGKHGPCLPLLLVYTTGAEERERISLDGTLRHSLPVMVQGLAAETADLADRLDQIALEVRGALEDTKLDGLLKKRLALIEEVTELVGEGEQPHGSVAMTWLAIYHTKEGAPAATV